MNYPRLLYIGDFSSSWGTVAAVCEELEPRLTERGWSVVTAAHHQPPAQRLAEMLATTWRRRNDYDVACVDVYSHRAFIWAEAVCRLLRQLHKPYILVLRGGDLPGFASRWPRRVNELFRHAAAITAPSSYLVAGLATFSDWIRVIPNPLDLPRYPFTARAYPRPELVWLRSFHEIYNPLLAIDVVGLLACDFPAVHLTMVGPDKGDGSLERTRAHAERRGVLGRVDFVGGIPKEDVPQWLNKSDIFLNTTDYDNTPVSVEEAMACGLCVVSTDVGGIPHLLADGVDALLVPPRDAYAMAAAVRRLLSDGVLAGRLSEAARATAVTFDWPHAISQWEDLFRAVAGR